MPQPLTKGKELRLHSPVPNVEAVVYSWPLQINDTVNEANEIIQTIKWVCRDFPELWPAMQNHVLLEFDSSSYDKMKALCGKYNRSIDNVKRLWSGQMPPKCLGVRASAEQVRHIFQQVYNHSVVDPEKLNQYEPFSPEVYGETSFELVNKIIEIVGIKTTDSFIDLGSGVGNVVLHVAATVECKRIIGVEKAERPAMYAKEMEKQFCKWMAWYGKRFTPFTLIHGDFLVNDFQATISSSSFIFANNFAFGPQVNHQLKERFAHLEEGTRLVSSREFCPVNFRITKRNLSDIGTILSVIELESIQGAVSWTDKPVSYYLHTVDRKRLEKYFHAQKYGGPVDGIGEDRDSGSEFTPPASRISLAPPPIENLSVKSNDGNENDINGTFVNGSGACTRHQLRLHLKLLKESRLLASQGGDVMVNGDGKGCADASAANTAAAASQDGSKTAKRVRVMRLTASAVQASSCTVSSSSAMPEQTAEVAEHTQPVAQWSNSPNSNGLDPLGNVQQRKKRERDQQKRRTAKLHQKVHQRKIQIRRNSGQSPSSPAKIIRSPSHGLPAGGINAQAGMSALNGLAPEFAISLGTEQALDNMLAEMKQKYLHYLRFRHQDVVYDANILLQQRQEERIRLDKRVALLEEQVSALKAKGCVLLQNRLDKAHLVNAEHVKTIFAAANSKNIELKMRLTSLETEMASASKKWASTSSEEASKAAAPTAPTSLPVLHEEDEPSTPQADSDPTSGDAASALRSDKDTDSAEVTADAVACAADGAIKQPTTPVAAQLSSSPSGAEAASSSTITPTTTHSGQVSVSGTAPASAAATSASASSAMNFPLKKRALNLSYMALASSPTTAITTCSTTCTSSQSPTTLEGASSTAAPAVTPSPVASASAGTPLPGSAVTPSLPCTPCSNVTTAACITTASPGVAGEDPSRTPTHGPRTPENCPSPLAPLAPVSRSVSTDSSFQPLWKPAAATQPAFSQPGDVQRPSTPPGSCVSTAAAVAGTGSAVTTSAAAEGKSADEAEDAKRMEEISRQVCEHQKVKTAPVWVPLVPFFLPDGHRTLASLSESEIQSCLRCARRRHFELNVRLQEEARSRRQNTGGDPGAAADMHVSNAAPVASQVQQPVPPPAIANQKPPPPLMSSGFGAAMQPSSVAAPGIVPTPSLTNILSMNTANNPYASLLASVSSSVVLAAATSPALGPAWAARLQQLQQQPQQQPQQLSQQLQLPQQLQQQLLQQQQQPAVANTAAQASYPWNGQPASHALPNGSSGGVSDPAASRYEVLAQFNPGTAHLTSQSQINEKAPDVSNVYERQVFEHKTDAIDGGEAAARTGHRKLSQEALKELPTTRRSVSVAEYITSLASNNSGKSPTTASTGYSSSARGSYTSNASARRMTPPPPPPGKPPRRRHIHSTSSNKGAEHFHHHHHDHYFRSNVTQQHISISALKDMLCSSSADTPPPPDEDRLQPSSLSQTIASSPASSPRCSNEVLPEAGEPCQSADMCPVSSASPHLDLEKHDESANVQASDCKPVLHVAGILAAVDSSVRGTADASTPGTEPSQQASALAAAGSMDSRSTDTTDGSAGTTKSSCSSSDAIPELVWTQNSLTPVLSKSSVLVRAIRSPPDSVRLAENSPVKPAPLSFSPISPQSTPSPSVAQATDASSSPIKEETTEANLAFGRKSPSDGESKAQSGLAVVPSVDVEEYAENPAGEAVEKLAGVGAEKPVDGGAEKPTSVAAAFSKTGNVEAVEKNSVGGTGGKCTVTSGKSTASRPTDSSSRPRTLAPGASTINIPAGPTGITIRRQSSTDSKAPAAACRTPSLSDSSLVPYEIEDNDTDSDDASPFTSPLSADENDDDNGPDSSFAGDGDEGEADEDVESGRHDVETGKQDVETGKQHSHAGQKASAGAGSKKSRVAAASVPVERKREHSPGTRSLRKREQKSVNGDVNGFAGSPPPTHRRRTYPSVVLSPVRKRKHSSTSDAKTHRGESDAQRTSASQHVGERDGEPPRKRPSASQHVAERDDESQRKRPSASQHVAERDAELQRKLPKPKVVSGALVVHLSGRANGSREVVAKRASSTASGSSLELPAARTVHRKSASPAPVKLSRRRLVRTSDSDRATRPRGEVVVEHRCAAKSSSSTIASSRSYHLRSRSSSPTQRSRSPSPAAANNKRSRSPRERRSSPPAQRRIRSPVKGGSHSPGSRWGVTTRRDSSPSRHKRSCDTRDAPSSSNKTEVNGDRRPPRSSPRKAESKDQPDMKRSSKSKKYAGVHHGQKKKAKKAAVPEKAGKSVQAESHSHRRSSKWCERFASSDDSDDGSSPVGSPRRT